MLQFYLVGRAHYYLLLDNTPRVAADFFNVNLLSNNIYAMIIVLYVNLFMVHIYIE
jgi:hypothetical protein